MNNKKCVYDKRKNCPCFCFCSPSPKQIAQPTPTVKVGLPFTLTLTVGACVVPQTKATGCKNTPQYTARRNPNCSPEQEKFLREFAKEYERCVAQHFGARKKNAGVGACGGSERACPRSAAPHCVFSPKWAGSPKSHLSITGGYLLTKPKIKIRTCYAEPWTLKITYPKCSLCEQVLKGEIKND